MRPLCRRPVVRILGAAAAAGLLVFGCRGRETNGGAPADARPTLAAATATPTAEPVAATAVPEAAIDLMSTPWTGRHHAPIEVVEYSDFLCPHCRAWGLAFHDFLPRVADRLSLHYKFFPLDACNPAFADRPLHPGACALATGGVCADEQGKFWPYHDRVFAGLPAGTPDRISVAALAAEIGLDAHAFAECLASPRPTARIAADIAEGTALGITGTPTVFVNRRRLMRLNETEPSIDTESRRLGLGPIPATP